MEWGVVLPYIFGFMAMAIAGWIARSIEKLSAAVQEMKTSVNELSTSLAVAIAEQKHLERRVTKLEDVG